jgi:hypothetical protein
MKKLIAIVTVGMSLVGCAQIGQSIERSMMSSIDVAKQDCSKMGFQFGTPQYQNCVMVTSNNISNQRQANSVSAKEAADRARDAMPKTITCTGTGSMRTCSTW